MSHWNIPHNVRNPVRAKHVTVDSTKPGTQFDKACVRFSKVYSDLRVIVEKGGRHIGMFRVAVHVEVKWIRVVSNFLKCISQT